MEFQVRAQFWSRLCYTKHWTCSSPSIVIVFNKLSLHFHKSVWYSTSTVQYSFIFKKRNKFKWHHQDARVIDLYWYSFIFKIRNKFQWHDKDARVSGRQHFVVFAGRGFQQIVGIPMGTNCAPLLAYIFLYSYEAEFVQSLFSSGRKQLASRFNFTYRYINDVLSINRCILLNLRSKIRQRATLQLLTWIYFCRSDGTVNYFHLLQTWRFQFPFHNLSFPG